MAQQQQRHPRQRPNNLGLPDLPAYNFLGDIRKERVIDNLPVAQARGDLDIIRKWIRFTKMDGTTDDELDNLYGTETLLKIKLDLEPEIYQSSSESESDTTSGSGIPLVALATMARQFRGHL